MDDKQYTIAKIIGEPRDFGKNGQSNWRFVFTTNETGPTMHSLFTRFPERVKIGASLYGHFEIQEKNGKTYSNFFFAKNPNKGGMSEADKTRMVELENKITTLTLRFNKLLRILVDKEILEMPNGKVPGTDIEYPDSNGPTAFDEDEISPEDIPFD